MISFSHFMFCYTQVERRANPGWKTKLHSLTSHLPGSGFDTPLLWSLSSVYSLHATLYITALMWYFLFSQKKILEVCIVIAAQGCHRNKSTGWLNKYIFSRLTLIGENVKFVLMVATEKRSFQIKMLQLKYLSVDGWTCGSWWHFLYFSKGLHSSNWLVRSFSYYLWTKTKKNEILEKSQFLAWRQLG